MAGAEKTIIINAPPNVVYDVIVDNPHATEEMKIETAEFLLDLPRPYDIFFYSLNF